MRTRSRDTVALLLDEMEILDLCGPLQVLTLAGRVWNFRPFKVHAVGRSAAAVTTRNQIPLHATHALRDAPPAEVLLVPGGYGARKALGDARLTEWLRDAASRAEAVLAVGLGVLLLAKTGVLDGEDVAAPPGSLELFEEHAPAVRPHGDVLRITGGKHLTARGGAAAVDAALDLTARLLGEKLACGVAAELGSTWQGPPERWVVHAAARSAP